MLQLFLSFYGIDSIVLAFQTKDAVPLTIEENAIHVDQSGGSQTMTLVQVLY